MLNYLVADKRGDIGRALKSNLIFIILMLIFFMVLFTFVSRQDNGTGMWEQYYSSEIARQINNAQVGDEIVLDIQKAGEISSKNSVAFSDIITIDNVNNEVRVKLGSGKGMGFRFYNDVDVVDFKLEPGFGDDINKLKFKIAEAKK